MNHYGYFHGPYGISLPMAGGKKLGPFGLKKAASSTALASGLTKKTAPDWLFDTEANVSLRMAARRSATYPYFQGKAQLLRALSLGINEELEDVQLEMEPLVAEWRDHLLAARDQLEAFEDEVQELGKGGGTVVLNWLLEWGETVGTRYLNPKVAVEEALSETRAALDTVRGQIDGVTGYLNNLTVRQELSQLATWERGEDLLGMSENVARSLGSTQREMLQGWWSEPGIDSWLASGGIKPWQPVCDLWRHSIDPKSWAIIEHERDLSAGYGMTMAGGTASGAGVYFMQPKQGQPGYKSYTTAETDVWGIRHLEDGCLASGVCPIASWTSPISRAEHLVRVQNAGLSLVTASQLNTLLSSVSSSLSTAASKLRTTKTRFNRLHSALSGTGYIFKPKIRAILESTGGPSALRGAGVALGLALGPLGVLAGLLLTEVAIASGISTLWSKLISGPALSAVDAGRARSSFLASVEPTISDSFQWWKDNTTALWRSERKSQLNAVKRSLGEWIAEYNEMEAKTQYIYPRRSAAQWISLGVDASCSARGPDFELPGGWEPPEIDGPGPKTGDGGEVEDIHAWDSGAMEVAFGSLVYDRGRKPKPGLSTWLILGGLIGVTYYYIQKEQR